MTEEKQDNVFDRCWLHYEKQLRKTDLKGVPEETFTELLDYSKKMYQAGASQGCRLLLERPKLIPAIAAAIREFEIATGMPEDEVMSEVHMVQGQRRIITPDH